VQRELGDKFFVELGMRYGEPSILSALKRLKEKKVEKIRVLPLYPQYASSTTGSTEELLLKLDHQMEGLPDLQFLPPFFEHPGFLKGFAEVGQFFLEEFKPDHILFSFHGLPERHLLKEDIGKNHCLKSPDCCEKIIPANAHCYRAHCFQSAYGIAKELGLLKGDYTIAFQSRLGRARWIHPFTDFVIREWAKQGKKRIAVFCPSFVTDCLETLEEIGIRAREDFVNHGGEDLLLIPSLNTHPTWVKAVAGMLRGT
jgi:ferrochelatase